MHVAAKQEPSKIVNKLYNFEFYKLDVGNPENWEEKKYSLNLFHNIERVTMSCIEVIKYDNSLPFEIGLEIDTDNISITEKDFPSDMSSIGSNSPVFVKSLKFLPETIITLKNVSNVAIINFWQESKNFKKGDMLVEAGFKKYIFTSDYSYFNNEEQAGEPEWRAKKWQMVYGKPFEDDTLQDKYIQLVGDNVGLVKDIFFTRNILINGF